jgi:hypothetical protein
MSPSSPSQRRRQRIACQRIEGRKGVADDAIRADEANSYPRHSQDPRFLSKQAIPRRGYELQERHWVTGQRIVPAPLQGLRGIEYVPEGQRILAGGRASETSEYHRTPPTTECTPEGSGNHLSRNNSIEPRMFTDETRMRIACGCVHQKVSGSLATDIHRQTQTGASSVSASVCLWLNLSASLRLSGNSATPPGWVRYFWKTGGVRSLHSLDHRLISATPPASKTRGALACAHAHHASFGIIVKSEIGVSLSGAPVGQGAARSRRIPWSYPSGCHKITPSWRDGTRSRRLK